MKEWIIKSAAAASMTLIIVMLMILVNAAINSLAGQPNDMASLAVSLSIIAIYLHCRDSIDKMWD